MERIQVLTGSWIFFRSPWTCHPEPVTHKPSIWKMPLFWYMHNIHGIYTHQHFCKFKNLVDDIHDSWFHLCDCTELMFSSCCMILMYASQNFIQGHCHACRWITFDSIFCSQIMLTIWDSVLSTTSSCSCHKITMLCTNVSNNHVSMKLLLWMTIVRQIILDLLPCPQFIRERISKIFFDNLFFFSWQPTQDFSLCYIYDFSCWHYTPYEPSMHFMMNGAIITFALTLQ